MIFAFKKKHSMQKYRNIYRVVFEHLITMLTLETQLITILALETWKVTILALEIQWIVFAFVTFI